MTRRNILEAALAVLRDGESVTLDSVARSVGMTKPGLMYHFPSKEALMLGVVDHVALRWEEQLRAILGRVPEDAGAADRIRAYVEFALSGACDSSDLAVLGDPRLRAPLAERWTSRLAPWVELPADLPEPARSRLTAARLLADGAWFADATDVFALNAAERAGIRAVAAELLVQS